MRLPLVIRHKKGGGMETLKYKLEENNKLVVKIIIIIIQQFLKHHVVTEWTKTPQMYMWC